MLTGPLQWGVRQSAEMEALMTSVERVLEYGKLEPEADLVIPSTRPEKSWPQNGIITFKDVWLQYGSEEKFVLKGLNFETKEREKVLIIWNFLKK